MPRCLLCPEHERSNPQTRQPSQHEIDAYDLVRANGFKFATEEKPLMGWFGPVDIMLTAYKIALMVDGEHHFPELSKRGMYGKIAILQQIIDQGFNEEVLSRAGTPIRGVLRLHCRDRSHWLHHIKRAVELVQQPYVKCFVIFTKSYNKTDTIKYH